MPRNVKIFHPSFIRRSGSPGAAGSLIWGIRLNRERDIDTLSNRMKNNADERDRKRIAERSREILCALDASIPNPRIALRYADAFQLLVATILSAQCTDERVNTVTPRLFRKCSNPRKLAEADVGELEGMIRPTGFYKSKAKSLIGCARALCERFGGRVPGTMEELLKLPGVGRKTANVILGACFGTPSIVVDTHVKRVARRLGLTSSGVPERIEEDLMRVIPRSHWTRGSLQLLLHGRRVCKAKNPLCPECVLRADCPYAEALKIAL